MPLSGEYLPPGTVPPEGGVAPPARRIGPVGILVVLAVVAVVVELMLRKHRLAGYQIVLFAVLIPSIILHEISHGLAAYACGDDTAKKAGRLTLNPIPHIDPLGSIVLPVMLTLSGFGFFGWAKPVPVDLSKLRHPRDQAVLVGIVGPLTNIVLAVILGLSFRVLAPPGMPAFLAAHPDQYPGPLGLQILYFAGVVNVLVAVFNLLPIPPLDGSALVERILPRSWLPGYYRVRFAMIIVVLLLVFTGSSVLNTIFTHALRIWADVLR